MLLVRVSLTTVTTFQATGLRSLGKGSLNHHYINCSFRTQKLIAFFSLHTFKMSSVKLCCNGHCAANLFDGASLKQCISLGHAVNGIENVENSEFDSIDQP